MTAVPLTATETPGPFDHLKATLWITVTLTGVAAGLTLLWLSMRSVMDIGGACGEGGPYVIRQQCPDGVPGLLIGGIWGGIVFAALYTWQSFKRGIPSFTWLFWPALFLSLGWNFLEYGVDPPGPEDSLVWGWLVCGVIFVLMGGFPLLLGVPGLFGRTPTIAKRAAAKPDPARLAALAQTKFKTGGGDLISQLEGLDGLHRSGALTDEEFIEAKRVLLAKAGDA